MDSVVRNTNFSNGLYDLEDVFSSEYFQRLELQFKTNLHSLNLPTEVLVTICIQAFVVFIGIVANVLVTVITIFGHTRQVIKALI